MATFFTRHRQSSQTFLEAAKKAGNDRALHDYGVRALEELDEEEHGRVRRLLKRK